jgi:hypothetical protein
MPPDPINELKTQGLLDIIQLLPNIAIRQAHLFAGRH